MAEENETLTRQVLFEKEPLIIEIQGDRGILYGWWYSDYVGDIFVVKNCVKAEELQGLTFDYYGKPEVFEVYVVIQVDTKIALYQKATVKF